MKKNPVIALALGLLLLIAGIAIYVTGGPPKADAGLAQACRQEVKARGGDAAMADQCDQTAFATALTATNADAAARSISAANTSEIGGSALAMFLIGIGLVLTIGGVALRRKQGAGNTRLP